MISTWILTDKKTGKYIMGHTTKEKPIFGNNGKEKATNKDYEWVKWGKELPEDIDSPVLNTDGSVKTKKVKIAEREVDGIVYNKYKLENGKLVKQ